MSSWTHIIGSVEVEPHAYSEHAARFVLQEVLDHLPVVSGSEGDMDWSIESVPGKNSFSSHDEFGQYYDTEYRYTNNTYPYNESMYAVQQKFIVHLYGHFRDRTFEETLKEFTKWVMRLSARMDIDDILVKVSGNSEHDYKYKEFIFSDADKFDHNYVLPSYTDDDFVSMGDYERLQSGRYLNFFTQYGQDIPWVEKLVGLLPAGHRALHEFDVLNGHVPAYNEDDYKRYLKSVINIAIGAKLRLDNQYPQHDKDNFDYSIDMPDEEYRAYVDSVKKDVCEFFNYSEGEAGTTF